MSYEKQTWQTGDTITAQKLNHMEGGIASGGSNMFIVTFTYDDSDSNGNWSADKTLAECSEAFLNGATLVATDGDGYYYQLSEAYVGTAPGFNFSRCDVSTNQLTVEIIRYYYDERRETDVIKEDSVSVTGQSDGLTE